MSWEIENKWAFLFFIPWLVGIVWYYWNKKNLQQKVNFVFSEEFKIKRTLKSNLLFLPIWLRFLALAVLIVAISSPKKVDQEKKVYTGEGVDIVLATDVSSSMLSRDFLPNRLEEVKKVAVQFVKNRPGDRIGLVIYAGEGFTQVPPTTDHRLVIDNIQKIQHGLLEDGTAIGMGLGAAINRLKDSDIKSKVVILLTDGENNSGSIDPRTAATIAKQQGIKVYTIGVGTKGLADTPVSYSFDGQLIFRKMKVSIDEDLLKYIAKTTNGKYFRATNSESLVNIYNEINSLEKSDISQESFSSYTHYFDELLLLFLALLLLEMLLRTTLLKTIA